MSLPLAVRILTLISLISLNEAKRLTFDIDHLVRELRVMLLTEPSRLGSVITNSTTPTLVGPDLLEFPNLYPLPIYNTRCGLVIVELAHTPDPPTTSEAAIHYALKVPIIPDDGFESLSVLVEYTTTIASIVVLTETSSLQFSGFAYFAAGVFSLHSIWLKYLTIEIADPFVIPLPMFITEAPTMSFRSAISYLATTIDRAGTVVDGTPVLIYLTPIEGTRMFVTEALANRLSVTSIKFAFHHDVYL